MKQKPSAASWWENVNRKDFSSFCIEKFGTNFDNAPTFIVRSEFIKTKGSETHTLYKQIHHGLEPLSAGRKVAKQGKQIAAQMSTRAMQIGQSLLGMLALLILASPVSAGPISGCVTSLPESFAFASPFHLQVGAWEDAAGCNPTGPNGRPTGGPYRLDVLPNGWLSVTMQAGWFNSCGSTQMDIREIGSSGQVVGYHDFIYNTGRDCPPSKPDVPAYEPKPSEGGWVPPAGPPTPSTPTTVPPVVTPLIPTTPPVSVPDSTNTFWTLGMGLAVLAWLRR